MLPESVYNFLKYGSGYKPHAVLDFGGYSYHVTRENDKITCTRFDNSIPIRLQNGTYNPEWRIKAITDQFPLNKIPSVDSTHWEEHITHEC